MSASSNADYEAVADALSVALTEQQPAIRLTAGQRKAILAAPPNDGWSRLLDGTTKSVYVAPNDGSAS